MVFARPVHAADSFSFTATGKGCAREESSRFVCGEEATLSVDGSELTLEIPSLEYSRTWTVDSYQALGNSVIYKVEEEGERVRVSVNTRNNNVRAFGNTVTFKGEMSIETN